MKTITIANNKGGVGKTTTALGLADALSIMGKKVLLIDMDPQCNSTNTSHGVTDDEYTMFDLLREECDINEAIQHKERYDLIPNDPELSGLESEFTTKLSKLKLLRRQLKEVKDDYDYAVIDTPPNFGYYMTSALLACDGVVMPLEAQKYAVDGLSQLLKFVNEAKVENEELEIYGVLLTQVDFRYAETKNFVSELPAYGKQAGFRVFDSMIRTCSDLQKAQNNIESIYEYNRSSKAVLDYESFAKELEEVIKDV